ncbi:MAG: lysostaphin resistance A-like protein [Candidatus Aenigmatarchaeota archaeon]
MANIIILSIGIYFVKKGEIKIGLERKRVKYGLIIFAIWWLSLSLIDFIAGYFLGMEPMTSITWNLNTFLQLLGTWLILEFGEEVVFRGYIQNKLKESFTRWKALGLAALLFSLWHVPGTIATGNLGLGTLTNVIIVTGFTFLVFNIPYDYSKLIVFIALFHGWNDMYLTATLNVPNVIGSIAGYIPYFILIFVYVRFLDIRPQNRVNEQ